MTQADQLAELLRKAILWTDQEFDVAPWREEAGAFLAAYRAQADASPPQVAQPQWQGMETAPKDGNPILVSTVNGLVRTARWSSHTKRWLIAWDANYSSTTERHATAWMPLPQPPKDAAAIGKEKA